jgi:hypothetical protein
MDSNKLPVVNIDALRRDAGKIIVDGDEHFVKQINGVAYHAFKTATSEQEALEAHYLAVGSCVPTLPEAKVRALTIDQMQAIVLLALGKITEVEKAFPNGVRPTRRKRRRSSASSR